MWLRLAHLIGLTNLSIEEVAEYEALRAARTAPQPAFPTGAGRPSMENRQLDAQMRAEGHWRATTRLMWAYLLLWTFFGFIIHFFVNQLNEIVIIGFPLGFYMAAQGSLIAFVVMLFTFARQQDNVDREYGFAEDE